MIFGLFERAALRPIRHKAGRRSNEDSFRKSRRLKMFFIITIDYLMFRIIETVSPKKSRAR